MVFRLGVEISQQDDGSVSATLLDERVDLQALAVPVPWIQLQWRETGGKIVTRREKQWWETWWLGTKEGKIMVGNMVVGNWWVIGGKIVVKEKRWGDVSGK